MRKLKSNEHRYLNKSGHRIISKSTKDRTYDKKLKLWIFNNIKQHYTQETITKFKLPIQPPEPDKEFILNEFEKRAKPKYEYYYDNDNNKKRRVIGIKGYDNMHFKQDLDKSLQNAKPQYEGNDIWQLNGYTGKTKNSAPIKLVFDAKQKTLSIYIREVYEVK